jgi:hypothetical protein
MNAPARSSGVLGTARRKSDAGNRGIPASTGGRSFDIVLGRWVERESDRVIRPVMPGNAGGGKDPDFWYAFDGSEEQVIGEEPRNTGKHQELSEEALS